MALRGVSAAVWWLCFGPNICSKSPARSLRSPSDLLKSPLLAPSWAFLGFVASCGSLWRISRGFAVKGVTLYPRKPASPLRCSLVVSRRSVSCSGFLKHSTAFRLHSLPAPALAVCICSVFTVRPYKRTYCHFRRFLFPWVFLCLGLQTVRPGFCGYSFMLLRAVAVGCRASCRLFPCCSLVSPARILSGSSRKPPASSLSALLGKLPGI